MSKIKLTNQSVKAIPSPKTGQILIRDSELRGFGVRAGSNSKVFFVEGQVNKGTRRVTIGRTDVFNADVARKKALSHLAAMASGI